MSSWAKPGVKCVCVHKGPWFLKEPRDPNGPVGVENHPDEGEVCTIQFVRTRRSGVLAFGIDGYPGNEYAARWFRPLITRTLEQDLALFRHLLSPSPADVGLIPAGVELVE